MVVSPVNIKSLQILLTALKLYNMILNFIALSK